MCPCIVLTFAFDLRGNLNRYSKTEISKENGFTYWPNYKSVISRFCENKCESFVFVDESRCFPKIDEIQSADSATLLNIFTRWMNMWRNNVLDHLVWFVCLQEVDLILITGCFFLIIEAFWPRSNPILTYMVNFIYLHYIHVYISLHFFRFLFSNRQLVPLPLLLFSKIQISILYLKKCNKLLT